jgi:hypothetical protein
MHRKRAAHGRAIAAERAKRLRQEAAAAPGTGSGDAEDTAGAPEGRGTAAGGAGQEGARHAATTAMALGDGVLSEGKYR